MQATRATAVQTAVQTAVLSVSEQLPAAADGCMQLVRSSDKQSVQDAGRNVRARCLVNVTAAIRMKLGNNSLLWLVTMWTLS